MACGGRKLTLGAHVSSSMLSEVVNDSNIDALRETRTRSWNAENGELTSLLFDEKRHWSLSFSVINVNRKSSVGTA